MNKNGILNVALLVGMVILGFLYINKDLEMVKKDQLIQAREDSLQTYRNKFGQQVAEIQVMAGDVNDMKAYIHSQDSTIKRLAEMVSKKTFSATIIENHTHVHGSTGTNISGADTLVKDSLIYIYPVYTGIFESEWIRETIHAGKDSIERDLVIRNRYEFSQEWEKPGKKPFNIFNRPVLQAKIVNLNPYTETKEVRSFATKAPKQNRGVWMGAGAAITVLAWLFIQR